MAAVLRVGDHARPENSAYRVARGDELLQDTLFAPRNIRRGLDMLAAYGETGGYSGLAYTPEMLHRFEEVLERRYNTTDGAYTFAMPHFAPYVDAETARFYGANTADESLVRTRPETFGEATERLLAETANELAPEMLALKQSMGWFEAEKFARYGPYNDVPYVHSDPDTTLLRNPQGGWCTIDLPASTSQKTNVVDLTQAVPDFTFATPHEGWLVDRPGEFWDGLPADGGPARAFY
jgi:hypothetical protein